MKVLLPFPQGRDNGAVPPGHGGADLEKEDAVKPEWEAEPAAGFAIEDTMTEFEVAQAEEAAEQRAILDSIQSETEVEANRCFLWEVDMALEV